MFQHLHHRGVHYLLLTAIALLLFLPNLGGPSLWDIDEGNNVQASYEMIAANNWHVPTFNFALRVDKPALLYWLQIFCALKFGVGEFAGRLPSALAALLTVLATFELGRSMFGAAAGLIAGLVLASSAMFGAAAHFANPDALLTSCAVLTFSLFWVGLKHSGRIWFVPVNAVMGLAMLAKGPVGILLPAAVVGFYLLRCGRLRLLLDRRCLLGVFTFFLVALPWYIWVGVDTKFVFIREFFVTHNFGRFRGSMEGHGGPFYYYLIVLMFGLIPWSIFLLPLLWHNCMLSLREKETLGGVKSYFELARVWLRVRADDPLPVQARSFLWCWIWVYLVFFSISNTKLPNYVLPIYPAFALLLGALLDGWRRGTITTPAWMMRMSLVALALLGVGTTIGFLIASGTVETPWLKDSRFPTLAMWAYLGVLPVLGALSASWCLRRGSRIGVMCSVITTAVLFLAPVAAWGGQAFDDYKAPRSLAELIHANQTEPEVRIGQFGYTQPSLVFYCRRKVEPLQYDWEACRFLQSALQVYLVTPVEIWQWLAPKMQGPYRIVGKRWDMYRRCEIVVVTNR